ncbi:hypothetical protein J132_09600 [Termitomyces sp. J132]|nr:hypothetical protein J132_09600 [Termitomyces sp. J132]
MVTGAHPTLPLDLEEATLLMQLPEGPLSTKELIGYCARALPKHCKHVEGMRERVGKDKLQWTLKFAEEHKNSIKDFDFKPLDLVLVKNMITESSHSAKMLPFFHGPMVVIAKTRGGNYKGLEHWVDITPVELKELREEIQKPSEKAIPEILFGLIKLHEQSDHELNVQGNNLEV